MGTRQDAVNYLSERLGDLRPQVAVVLGSGLGGMSSSVRESQHIPFGEIPGFPETTVAGHGGELVAGVLDDVPVILQCGRSHLYEGHHPDVVALPVRAFVDLGVQTLVMTNAAGGIRSTFVPPVLMLIADHVNLMWRNPLVGPVLKGEGRFPDMSEPYDAELRVIAREVAIHHGIPLEEGVYAGVLGPSYETPAEIQMLARLGADAVGMSTVPEVIAARARGVRVLGISTITNVAAGISHEKISHEEVLEAGQQVSDDLTELVRGVVAEWVGGR